MVARVRLGAGTYRASDYIQWDSESPKSSVLAAPIGKRVTGYEPYARRDQPADWHGRAIGSVRGSYRGERSGPHSGRYPTREARTGRPKGGAILTGTPNRKRHPSRVPFPLRARVAIAARI